jgi:WD40 repeat protein
MENAREFGIKKQSPTLARAHDGTLSPHIQTSEMSGGAEWLLSNHIPSKAAQACCFNHVDAGHADVFASVGKSTVNVYRCGDETIELEQSYVITPNPSDKSQEKEILYVCAWTIDTNSGAPLLLVGGSLGVLHVINCATRCIQRTIRAHGQQLYEIRVHPLYRFIIITAGMDESCRMWNLRTGQCVAIFAGDTAHRAAVLSADFHATGDCMTSCGIDGTVKVWRLDHLLQHIRLSSYPYVDLAAAAVQDGTLVLPPAVDPSPPPPPPPPPPPTVAKGKRSRGSSSDNDDAAFEPVVSLRTSPRKRAKVDVPIIVIDDTDDDDDDDGSSDGGSDGSSDSSSSSDGSRDDSNGDDAYDSDDVYDGAGGGALGAPSYYSSYGRSRSYKVRYVQQADFSTRAIHKNYIDCVRFYGDWLISKSLNSKLVLWKIHVPDGRRLVNSLDTASAAVKLHEFHYTDSNLWFLSFTLSFDKQMVAVGNNSGSVFVWDMEEPSNVPEKLQMQFDPAGKKGSYSSVCGGGVTEDPGVDTSCVRDVSFHRNGRTLIAVSDAGSICRWEMTDGRDESPSEEV